MWCTRRCRYGGLCPRHSRIKTPLRSSPHQACAAHWLFAVLVQTFAPINHSVIIALEATSTCASPVQQHLILSLAHSVFSAMWRLLDFAVDAAVRLLPTHRLRLPLHCLIVQCMSVLKDAMNTGLGVTALVLGFPATTEEPTSPVDLDGSGSAVGGRGDAEVPVGGGVAWLLRVVGQRLPLSPYVYDTMEAVQGTATCMTAALLRQCRLAITAAGVDGAGMPADRAAQAHMETEASAATAITVRTTLLLLLVSLLLLLML